MHIWCKHDQLQTSCVVFSLQQMAKAMAGVREFETDLGQLPGHHPLIKDGMSDEGVSEHFPLSACSLYLTGN